MSGWQPKRKFAGTALAIFFGVQIAIAVFLEFRSVPLREAYPFFSWALFADAESPARRLEVLVEEMNGVAIVPPARMSDDSARFPEARSASAQFRRLIGIMAELQERGDPALDRVRITFERLYFPQASGARYSLVRRELDPVDYWRTRRVIRDEPVFQRAFERGKP